MAQYYDGSGRMVRSRRGSRPHSFAPVALTIVGAVGLLGLYVMTTRFGIATHRFLALWV